MRFNELAGVDLRQATSSSRLLPPHPVRTSPTRSSSRWYGARRVSRSRGVWA